MVIDLRGTVRGQGRRSGRGRRAHQGPEGSHSYYLAQQVDLSDVFGPVRYYIWVKGHKPAAAATGTKAKKPKKKS